MYKLGILILLSSHFVFANHLETVCKSDTDSSNIEISTGFLLKACEESHWLGSRPVAKSSCLNSSSTHNNHLMRKGWSQKQINFISYYILKDKPRNTKLDLNPYKYISDNYREPHFKTPGELTRFVNEVRSKIGLEPNNTEVNFTIDGCTNLFKEKPKPQPLSFENELLNRYAFYLCKPYTDDYMQTVKFNGKVCEAVDGFFKSSSCFSTSNRYRESLVEKGWSQKQINFISYYILDKKPDDIKLDPNPYKYLLDNHPEPPLQNPIKFSRLVNETRRGIGLPTSNIQVDFTLSECTDLFKTSPEETHKKETQTTEATAPCVDCSIEKNTDSAIERFRNTIERRGESPHRNIKGI